MYRALSAPIVRAGLASFPSGKVISSRRTMGRAIRPVLESLEARQLMTGGLPAWLDASSAATWDATTHALTVTGSATVIADPGADLPVVTADGASASLLIRPTNGDAFIRLGGLTLTGGATADMASVGIGRTQGNHNVLVIGTVSGAAPTFSIDAANGSKLDLEDNDLIVHSGNFASIQAAAAIGRNVAPGGIFDGTWTGAGITSSVAAAIDGPVNAGFELVTPAVVLNSDLFLGTKTAWTVGTGTGEALSANDVLVKYTYNGDLTLDGLVSDNSVTVFNTFYDPTNSSQNDFAFGDLNGDGKVDDSDVTIFNTLYGSGTVTVVNSAAASPSTTTGAATTLSVLGGTAAGESSLHYTWTILGTPPASVGFSDNGTNSAKNVDIILSTAGTYDMQVSITDSIGASTTSTVSVTVTDPADSPRGDVPAGYYAVDTIDVNANGDHIQSNVTLEDGVEYYVVASGTVQIATSPSVRVADAQSYQSSGSTSFTHNSLPNLVIDGVSDWGEARTDHIYTTTVTGTGQTLDAYFNDTYYADNAGSMRFMIFAKPKVKSISVKDLRGGAKAPVGSGVAEVNVTGVYNNGELVDWTENETVSVVSSTPGITLGDQGVRAGSNAVNHVKMFVDGTVAAGTYTITITLDSDPTVSATVNIEKK